MEKPTSPSSPSASNVPSITTTTTTTTTTSGASMTSSAKSPAKASSVPRSPSASPPPLLDFGTVSTAAALTGGGGGADSEPHSAQQQQQQQQHVKLGRTGGMFLGSTRSVESTGSALSSQAQLRKKESDVFDLDLFKRSEHLKMEGGFSESNRNRGKRAFWNVIFFPLRFDWWRKRVPSVVRRRLRTLIVVFVVHSLVVALTLRTSRVTPLDLELEAVLPVFLLLVLALIIGRAGALSSSDSLFRKRYAINAQHPGNAVPQTPLPQCSEAKAQSKTPAFGAILSSSMDSVAGAKEPSAVGPASERGEPTPGPALAVPSPSELSGVPGRARKGSVSMSYAVSDPLLLAASSATTSHTSSRRNSLVSEEHFAPSHERSPLPHAVSTDSSQATASSLVATAATTRLGKSDPYRRRGSPTRTPQPRRAARSAEELSEDDDDDDSQDEDESEEEESEDDEDEEGEMVSRLALTSTKQRRAPRSSFATGTAPPAAVPGEGGGLLVAVRRASLLSASNVALANALSAHQQQDKSAKATSPLAAAAGKARPQLSPSGRAGGGAGARHFFPEPDAPAPTAAPRGSSPRASSSATPTNAMIRSNGGGIHPVASSSGPSPAGTVSPRVAPARLSNLSAGGGYAPHPSSPSHAGEHSQHSQASGSRRPSTMFPFWGRFRRGSKRGPTATSASHENLHGLATSPTTTLSAKLRQPADASVMQLPQGYPLPAAEGATNVYDSNDDDDGYVSEGTISEDGSAPHISNGSQPSAPSLRPPTPGLAGGPEVPSEFRTLDLAAQSSLLAANGLYGKNLAHSHSMDDLLESIKSVHWSATGPEKVLLTPAQIRKELESKVEKVRGSDTYDQFAYWASVVAGLLPVLFRVWCNGWGLICPMVHRLGLEEYVQFEIRACPEESLDSDFQTRLMLFLSQVFGTSPLLEWVVVVSSALSTFVLSLMLLNAVAGVVDTYRRRYLYAKLFSKLTSSRKAQRADLPHFRLYKVDHIKVWLSLRSRRMDMDRTLLGPYKSSDTTAHALIVSGAFLVGAVAFRALQRMSVSSGSLQPSTLSDVVLLYWAATLSVFLQRVMSLASKTHERYQDTSVLLTEELNIHMRLLRKPHKRDELQACNNMLKVAGSIIKELEGGKSKNGQMPALVLDPNLYAVIRVILLSALGALTSDLFGFRVRLWKI